MTALASQYHLSHSFQSQLLLFPFVLCLAAPLIAMSGSNHQFPFVPVNESSAAADAEDVHEGSLCGQVRTDEDPSPGRGHGQQLLANAGGRPCDLTNKSRIMRRS
jgi:hypothetical protein